MFPIFATFKEGTKLTYGCVVYFSASVAVRTLGKALFGVDQDPGSISAALSGN